MISIILLTIIEKEINQSKMLHIYVVLGVDRAEKQFNHSLTPRCLQFYLKFFKVYL